MRLVKIYPLLYAHNFIYFLGLPMSVYLEKIKRILGTFEPEEQNELKKYYLDRSVSLLLDDKRIGNAKIHLLRDMEEIVEEEDLRRIQNDAMDHKVLQTRALVLDLITTDYTKDANISKPEKWVKEIVKDIKETFLRDDTKGQDFTLLALYNEKLVEEFKKIFLTDVATFGTSGNQLVLDLTFYSRFISEFVSFDFGNLFKEIQAQIDANKVMEDSEIEEILNKNKEM